MPFEATEKNLMSICLFRRSTNGFATLLADRLSDCLRQGGHQFAVLRRVEEEGRGRPLRETLFKFVPPAAVGRDVWVFVDAEKVWRAP